MMGRRILLSAMIACLWLGGCDDEDDDTDDVVDGGVVCAAGTHNQYDVCVPDAEIVAIAGGTFDMGIEDGGNNPIHSVTLSSYNIDKYEVTNLKYRACVDAGVCEMPSDVSSYSGRTDYFASDVWDNFPAIYVTWQQAVDYCVGLGMTLPTEAQWEMAARGTGGGLYPWGDDAPNSTFANWGAPYTGDTAAVGSYPAGDSPFGLADMSGNVREWVNDYFTYSYYESGENQDPVGPTSGTYRVTRGGSFVTQDDQLQAVTRTPYHPMDTYSTLGFRCVSSNVGGN